MAAAEGRRKRGGSVGGGGAVVRNTVRVLRRLEVVRTVANESDGREGARQGEDAVDANGQDARKRRGQSWTRA